MCLSKSINANFDIKGGIGWKAMFITSENKAALFDGHYHVNTWVKAENSYNDTIDDDDNIQYPSGFHVLLTREAARNYTSKKSVCKVKFRKVVAIGTQRVKGKEEPCIIAKEIFIEVPRLLKKTKKTKKTKK